MPRSSKTLAGANTVSFAGEIANTPAAGAVTVDWTAGQYQNITGNAATVTMTFVNPLGPCKVTLKLIQDASGSRAWAFPAGMKWSSATVPTWSTVANRVDFAVGYFDGTTWWWTGGTNFA
jgi:hypothetical protein